MNRFSSGGGEKISKKTDERWSVSPYGMSYTPRCLHIFWSVSCIYRFQPGAGGIFHLFRNQSGRYRTTPQATREHHLRSRDFPAFGCVDSLSFPRDFNQKRIQKKEDHFHYPFGIFWDSSLFGDYPLGLFSSANQCNGLQKSEWGSSGV